MKRVAIIALLLLLAGCRATPKLVEPPPVAEAPPPETVPAPPADPRPDLMAQEISRLTRDEARDGLLRLLEAPGAGGPAERLRKLEKRPEFPEVPWQEADLDGNGTTEYVLALPVRLEEGASVRNSAAIFVIYQQDGRWAVDRSEPMDKIAELELRSPTLHAVADLAGLGTPQIIWSRPESIATGPAPRYVFVTTWKPGTFTHLPGQMAISSGNITLDGKDLLLTGISREEWFVRTEYVPTRTDRYRFVDGAFRLVDRRFINPSDWGYDRFWDGLVAEEVGRLQDAEREYRFVADPKTVPHPGKVPVYKGFPRELTLEEMTRFGEALRTFARFRLGALLKQQGREADIAPTGPYAGLIEAMRKAPDRKSGCAAGAAWAAANPQFLKDLNLGVGNSHWTPDLLCTHMPLEEKL